MKISIHENGFQMFILLFLVSLIFIFTNGKNLTQKLEIENSAFDTSLYENALDTAECEKQLSYIRSNANLRLQFLDAGLRTPKFISQGNYLDMGNYHGCLGIQQALGDSRIEGKYCMINVPAYQQISFTEIPESPRFYEFSGGIFQNSILSEVKDLNKLISNEGLINKVKLFRKPTFGKDNVTKSVINNLDSIKFRMAVCIPKPCTISEGLIGLLNNETASTFVYEEEFCRLPNDKPWALADYIAILLFSVIGILTILSTLFDLRNQFILQRDAKSVNPLYTSFSVYTNARRLTTFRKDSHALECVDGVKALSMAWIHLFHVFHNLPPASNVADYWNWKMSRRSMWVTSAHLAVDAFLTMSGMLLVYANAGKITEPDKSEVLPIFHSFTGCDTVSFFNGKGKKSAFDTWSVYPEATEGFKALENAKLIRNLHLFYLNRILRMFPLLAAGILMQASFIHWLSDGPLWQDVANATDVCRNYWWLNMLYVNNFIAPCCITATWYLALDMQLHILSPVLLYFVLSGSRRQAGAALAAGLLAVMMSSTVFVFTKQLPGSTYQFWRVTENSAFMDQYFFNTLPRVPPFFVGMIFGYILHLCRQNHYKQKFSKIIVLFLWCLIIVMGAIAFYSPEVTKDANHYSQTVNNFINAFARPLGACAVASLVVVCLIGYGGPVNWFLSLQLWKLISRVSYAMYLFQSPLILVISGSYVQPAYFSVYGVVFTFFSIFFITFIVSFIATVVIELPFSTLFNQLLGRGLKVPQKESGVKIAEKDP